ncbi:hypothetical protein AOQ84DRAFT_391716 [Glonium stellatum]|uniref:Uncharacterized protein n=1 Tax=Glonium stellatum TaxID=574774 RepID=A0A8E2JNZ9_9PEZI|nr:hypothetical protein AOQ84DRAFT_391716 [Glonium stellatum]
MDALSLFRQLLRAPYASYNLVIPPLRHSPRTRTLFLLLSNNSARRLISTESLPRVVQPSLWHSIVPRFLRQRAPADTTKAPKSKEWNPATPYIILALLIGSQAIQTIALKNDIAAFSRKADAKIGLLREVVERVQRGENVNVEKVLGTGNKESEREWEDVLKELEEEESLFQSRKRRKAMKEAAAIEDMAREQEELLKESEKARQARANVQTGRGPKFY